MNIGGGGNNNNGRFGKGRSLSTSSSASSSSSSSSLCDGLLPGGISGLYYHKSSEKFQSLSLRHVDDKVDVGTLILFKVIIQYPFFALHRKNADSFNLFSFNSQIIFPFIFYFYFSIDLIWFGFLYIFILNDDSIFMIEFISFTFYLLLYKVICFLFHFDSLLWQR